MFYEKSLHYNWEKLFSIMQEGSRFINDYSAELLANNNMPPTFQAEFDQLFPELIELYIDFASYTNDLKKNIKT